MEKLTIEELKQFNDDEIITYLKEQWNIPKNESIDVIGMLSSRIYEDKFIYSLNKVEVKNADAIEYPIIDASLDGYISRKGIYVPPNINEIFKASVNDGDSLAISCTLVLTYNREREKHNNPCELMVEPNSIKLLHEIEDEYIIRSEDQRVLIKNSIVQRHIIENKKFIDTEIKKINDDRDLLIIDARIKKEEVESLEQQRSAITENITLLKDSINEKEEYKRSILNELEALKILLKEDEEVMGAKLEKFRSFIKDKADNLLKLEFIEQEEYDELLMLKNEKEDNVPYIDFHEELNGNFAEAVSHIQAYLYQDKIFYPRYIIEDFFALVQTNDLIILAGESGSGKTNLIKSFAKAVGGKFEIIPVKPNWTSAEDLLGYYNPLEKKYLSTPFLDALFEARRNPDIPYFICLDEMNLARVEYYFADFLSLLEERNELPEIKLYSEDESSHVLSEFKNVLHLIEQAKDKYQKNNILDFVSMLQDEEINNELKRVFGFSDKDSLIKYHSDLRRMISGIINTPSSIVLPKNVRIIGAINIDETTHYLSPKILDRAHIMKFDSPLLNDWEAIGQEVQLSENSNLKLKFKIEDFGERAPYPSFDMEDNFVKTLIGYSKKYFNPLGIEVGMRTIRQGLGYREIFLKFNDNKPLVFNNFIIHKILPKMTFDGNKSDKKAILTQFKNTIDSLLKDKIDPNEGRVAIEELEILMQNAESNDNIVNYWA